MRAINELCGLPGLVAMGFIPIKPILKNPEATSPTQPVQFLKQKELSLLREKGIVGDNLDFKSHRIITHLSLVWIFSWLFFCIILYSSTRDPLGAGRRGKFPKPHSANAVLLPAPNKNLLSLLALLCALFYRPINVNLLPFQTPLLDHNEILFQ